MKEHNYNQVQMAEKLGVQQSTVSVWLSGKKEPSIENLWKLADFFGIDVDFLIGRKEY